jgi:hypothetical protein
MCHMAPDLASRLRWALALPRVLWLRTSPPGRGGLRRYHVSYGFEPHLPYEVGFGDTTCPTGPYGSRASSIKKCLPGLPVQLGTHVPNTHTHIFRAPQVRVIMRLQDVQTDNVVNTCKVCRQASTVRLQYNASTMTTRMAPLQCQMTRQHDATLLTECSVAGDKTRHAHTVETSFATPSH